VCVCLNMYSVGDVVKGDTQSFRIRLQITKH